MLRRPPRSTRTDTLLPYTTLFRSPSLRVLNKADLADPEATQAWLNHYNKQDGVRAVALSCKKPGDARSEEHTSELQSLMRISYAVFCLNKKKNNNRKQQNRTHTT